MTETTTRALELITEIRKRLDEAEQTLKDINLTSEQALSMESTLVGIRWNPFFMGLTGPHGYNPQLVFEKCTKCDHYRIKK